MAARNADISSYGTSYPRQHRSKGCQTSLDPRPGECRNLIKNPLVLNPQYNGILIKNPIQNQRFLNQVPTLPCTSNSKQRVLRAVARIQVVEHFGYTCTLGQSPYSRHTRDRADLAYLQKSLRIATAMRGIYPTCTYRLGHVGGPKLTTPPSSHPPPVFGSHGGCLAGGCGSSGLPCFQGVERMGLERAN